MPASLVKADRINRVFIQAFSLLLLHLLVFSSGCSLSDVFPPRIDNQVAYFNTYYNASRLYREAIQEIENTEKSQRERGLPPQKEISQNVRQKLTSVIEKCSKLLMYYPNSKWVDDALMLIGKSYYYMGEYPKAERKFNELLEQLPNSDLVLEAHLWLGKSYRQANEFEQGIRELKAAAETAIIQEEDEVAAEALLTLGEIHAERSSYAEAIAAYQDLITRTDQDESKAQAQYRIGELHEKTEDYAKAAAAYLKVLAFKSDNYLKFQSSLRYAVNATRIGQYEDAMKVLNDLLANDANIRFFPLIKLEIANTLNAMGQIEEAIKGYEIVDTMYARTDAAAKGYYQLGLLYEKTLRNYRAADTNYVRARSEYQPSDVTPLAARRADNLRRYFLYRQSIQNTDSMLFQAHVAQSARPDTALSQHEDSSSSNPIAERDSAKGLHFEIWGLATSSPTVENLRLALARHTYDLGTLFFLDLEEPDSALFWCTQTAIVSPDSELAARALFTIAEIRQTYRRSDPGVVDSIYRRIIAEYPETKYAAEVRRRLGLGADAPAEDPAASLYRKAERLMLSDQGPEAIELLQQLLERYPLSSYAAKAQYAIGWIYENIEGIADSAATHYKALIRLYPASSYAANVASRLAEKDRWDSEMAHRGDSTSVDSASLALAIPPTLRETSRDTTAPDHKDRKEISKAQTPLVFMGTSKAVIERVNFAFDSADLTPEARAVLEKAAQVLVKEPKAEIVIEGHADSIGTKEYNELLSQRRAKAARDWLVTRGIPATRVRTLGKGFSEPIASNATVEGRAKNRRAEIQFMSLIPQVSILRADSLAAEKKVSTPLDSTVVKEAEEPKPPRDEKDVDDLRPRPSRRTKPDTSKVIKE